MKAVVIHQFGGPEQLVIEELPTPTPQQYEVRIKVAFASVNPVDWKIREGFLQGMFPHCFPIVLGWDLSGVVDQVGAGVTRFKAGDRVYAYARKPKIQWGTYAEYVTLEETVVSKIPNTLSLELAATIPLVGLTAWQALHRFDSDLRGKDVVIHGASGGVGGFAVQFAKALGAHVLATSSKGNLEYLKMLGADTVVDYQTNDVAGLVRKIFPNGVDLVLDTVGGGTLEKSYSSLRSGGELISIVDEPDEGVAKQRGIRAAFVFVSPNADELDEIAKQVDANLVRVPHYRVMPLDQVRQAHELSRSGHVRGKLLLKV